MNHTNQQIKEFLDRPLLARLATVDPQTMQPHVVPVWYLWDGVDIWISGFRSTRKFHELGLNEKCAVVIDSDDSQADPRGVLMEGKAELVTSPRQVVKEMSARIYIRYLGEDGVLEEEPQSWIHDPENLVARIHPAKIFSWK
jgi:nitroimidazol reductase NimA-like FMN-containing flavoprotein (pyridoxamine 5'-phosphate oxidase superfamily)